MNIGALIVDDEADIRRLMRMLIEAENAGLHVSGEAADGEEALRIIDELDPEIVVLDERMPGLSGVETALALLQRRPGQRIIVCSAHLDTELRRRAEEAGATMCLPKTQIAQIPAAMRAVMTQA